MNRPFITILNEMGVRHRTFQQLQEDMLKTLTDILFEERKAAAFLESKTPNGLFVYKDLSRSGLYLTTEPFFRALLLALHRHHVGKYQTTTVFVSPFNVLCLVSLVVNSRICRISSVLTNLHTKNRFQLSVHSR